MRRTSLGAAEPELASTLTSPRPGPGPKGAETKDQRPSAVTATPNGSPGTRDSVTSAAGSRGPGAVAVLQPGLPRAVVRAEDAGIASGAGRDGGEAVGPVSAGP